MNTKQIKNLLHQMEETQPLAWTVYAALAMLTILYKPSWCLATVEEIAEKAETTENHVRAGLDTLQALDLIEVEANDATGCPVGTRGYRLVGRTRYLKYANKATAVIRLKQARVSGLSDIAYGVAVFLSNTASGLIPTAHHSVACIAEQTANCPHCVDRAVHELLWANFIRSGKHIHPVDSDAFEVHIRDENLGLTHDDPTLITLWTPRNGQVYSRMIEAGYTKDPGEDDAVVSVA